MDCATERQHHYVRMLLKNGDMHHQTIRVEAIGTKRVGSVAACVAPLFRFLSTQWPDTLTNTSSLNAFLPFSFLAKAHAKRVPHRHLYGGVTRQADQPLPVDAIAPKNLSLPACSSRLDLH